MSTSTGSHFLAGFGGPTFCSFGENCPFQGFVSGFCSGSETLGGDGSSVDRIVSAVTSLRFADSSTAFRSDCDGPFRNMSFLTDIVGFGFGDKIILFGGGFADEARSGNLGGGGGAVGPACSLPPRKGPW
jgi:hypothetical protein